MTFWLKVNYYLLFANNKWFDGSEKWREKDEGDDDGNGDVELDLQSLLRLWPTTVTCQATWATWVLYLAKKNIDTNIYICKMLSQDNVNIIYYIYKAVYGKRVYATYTCQSLGEIRVTTHNIGLDQHRTFMTSQILCWILVRDGSQQLCQNSNTNWKVFSFSGWEDVCCRLQSQPQPGCLDRRAWWLVGTDAGFNSIQKSFYWFQFWESLGGATSGAFKSGFVRFHPSGQVRQTTWRPRWAFGCHAAIESDPVFQENKKKTTHNIITNYHHQHTMTQWHLFLFSLV